MRLGARRLTWPEVCEGAGVEHAVADLLWRALGFPDVPSDERAYTDDDLRALQIAAEGIGELTDGRREAALELVVGEARAVSAHLTRIAEIEVDAIAQMSELGLRERTVGQAFERGLARSDLGWLLLYGLRRRLDEALRRRTGLEAGHQPILAVGFVDLVDFTRTSNRLDVEELGRLLSRFESLVSDAVTEAGGRVVKLIGDEAMFVCPSPAGAALAALDVLACCATSDLPPARAGLALGPLVPRVGDYFGPTVNLASRLIDLAEPGAIVVDQPLAEAVRPDAPFCLDSGGRARLKGIGDVAFWRLRQG